jgi:hypothetical protein
MRLRDLLDAWQGIEQLEAATLDKLLKEIARTFVADFSSKIDDIVSTVDLDKDSYDHETCLFIVGALMRCLRFNLLRNCDAVLRRRVQGVFIAYLKKSCETFEFAVDNREFIVSTTNVQGFSQKEITALRNSGLTPNSLQRQLGRFGISIHELWKIYLSFTEQMDEPRNVQIY